MSATDTTKKVEEVKEESTAVEETNTTKTPAKKKSTKKTAKKSTKKTAKKSTPKKAKKPTSPYGIALAVMAHDPDQSKKQLIAKCKQKHVDVDKGATAITTAYSCMRTCVRLLRENKLMSPAEEKA